MKAIIFDFDGLIVDTETIWFHSSEMLFVNTAGTTFRGICEMHWNNR